MNTGDGPDPKPAANLNPEIPMSRGMIGCLIPILAGCALVSGLMIFIALFAFVMAASEGETQKVSFFSASVILLFSLPMFILFVRGIMASVQKLRGKPEVRLVTVRLAWMLVAFYAIPTLVASVVLLISRPEAVNVRELVAALGGIAILCAGPFFIGKMQRKKPADGAGT